MRVHFAGCWPGFRSAPYFCVLLSSIFLGLPCVVQADVLVEPGQSALLTVSVSVEGNVNAPQGKRDEVIRWSTQRKLEASVRMVSEKPEQLSLNAMAASDPNAMPEVYTDIASQAEACGEDQACLMRMAMAMMNNPEFNEATEAGPRYQMWKAADDNAVMDVKVSYLDKWYSLFYVSGPEINDCTLTAPMVSPELTRSDPSAQATWDKINQETLQASAKGFAIETDSETGISTLYVSGIGAGSGDEKCIETIGANAVTHNRSTNGSLLPVGELKVPLTLTGAAPGTGVISSGSEVIDTQLDISHLGGGFKVDVKVPLKVKVSWELKAQ